MTTDFRAQAEQKIEAYRAASEWTPSRQVALQCIAALWSQTFTVARIARLSGPLTGVELSERLVAWELRAMRKAGLLRMGRASNLDTTYEITLQA